jgi:hypothetical protein
LALSKSGAAASGRHLGAETTRLRLSPTVLRWDGHERR